MSFELDKMQIDNALGVNTYQMPAGAPQPGQQFGAPAMGAPPQQPQPMAGRFGGLSMAGGAQAGPGHFQAGASFGPGMGFQGAQAGYAMPMAGGQLNINANVNPLFKLAQLGAQFSKGNVGANVQYQPGQGVGGGVQWQHGPLSMGGGYDRRRGFNANLGWRQPLQQGGLVTPQSNEQFMHDRDQQMHEMVGKVLYDQGGFAVK